MNSFLQTLTGAGRPGAIPTEIFLLLLVLGVLIFLWDLFDRRYQQLAEKSEFSSLEILALKNDENIPTKTFSSDILGLKGTPDALVKEGKQIIPVDIVPLSSKVQDRHVIKILTYLRLIEEEFENSPPYGILLMGKKRRVVKIQNTTEKQRWLETQMDEMHSILDGVPAVAKPSPKKCRHCDVKDSCEYAES